VDGRRLQDLSSSSLASLSHTGYRRAQNQDAVAAAASSPGEPPWAALVVCDGVSTSPLSAQAARYVAIELSASLRTLVRPPAEEDTEQALREAILRAHRGLCREAGSWSSASPPGTTVVAALLRGSLLTVGWVGDSRAYWFGRGEGFQLTSDHSWLNEVVRRGELTEEHARTLPQAHAITRCLGPLEGPNSDAEPEVLRRELSGPGVLLLCTDGLWNYTPTLAQLRALVVQEDQDAGAIARRLVDHALQQGGGDNVSVVVYRHEERSISQAGARTAILLG
jgi:serine/threonine protein phosphatase PrpC